MFLEHGVCPAPCARHIGDFLDPALFIGDKTLPAQLRPSVSKFVADTPEAQRADGTVRAFRRRSAARAWLSTPPAARPQLPPAPPGVTSRDCLMKPAYELPERLSATAAPTAPDHCLCIDPCRRFKTCDECVANKQLSELPPPGLSPQEAEDYSPPNWSRAGSPYNCGWCQNRCVSGARDGPTVGGDQCLHWTYRMEQCKVGGSRWSGTPAAVARVCAALTQAPASRACLRCCSRLKSWAHRSRTAAPIGGTRSASVAASGWGGLASQATVPTRPRLASAPGRAARTAAPTRAQRRPTHSLTAGPDRPARPLADAGASCLSPDLTP